MLNSTKRFSGRELIDNAQGDPVIHPGRGNQLLSGLFANHGIFGLSENIWYQVVAGTKNTLVDNKKFFNRDWFFFTSMNNIKFCCVRSFPLPVRVIYKGESEVDSP